MLRYPGSCSRDPRELPRQSLAKAVEKAIHPDSAEAGFGLLGLIVGLALSAAVVGVAYTAYRTNQQASDVSVSTQLATDVSQKVLSSYASSANFSGLSTQSAEQVQVFPANVLKGGLPVNTWGGAIDLTAVNIAGAAGPGSNNGFALTFEQVPSSTCASFALHGGQGFYGVNVNSASVMTGNRVNVAAASTLCNQNATNTVQFIQAKTSPNGATSPVLTPCVPPPDGSQPLNCPAGQLSSVAPYGPQGILQTNHSFCTSPYGAYGTTPWTTVSNTCVPACVPPAPVVTPGAQTASCPAGQVTIASGSPTFPQTNTQTTTYTCPLPIGSATPIVNPPTAWTPLASAVCAPQCIAPPATTGSQAATGTCPAGQVTSSGATTFAQTQTRSITYSCPAPTGSYTTAYGPWSAATPAVSSVCAPKCTAPSPTPATPNYQWVNANPGCPAGQTGSYTYQYQQVQTGTITYTCPAPQGSYTSSTSYGGWSNTGATQNVVNTCAPVTPPAPPPPPTASANGCTATGIPGGVGVSSTPWSLTWAYGTTVEKTCTCSVTLSNNGASQGVSLTASAFSKGGGTYYGYSSGTYTVGGGTFTVGVMINASPSTYGGNSYWGSTCQISVALPNGGAEP